MLEHIHEAARRLERDVMRHRHSQADYGYLTEPGSPSLYVSHPLSPEGAGGKLALFVVEALCLILGNQADMKEQIDRLNSIVEMIASRIGNVDTDVRNLLEHVQKAADPATDDTADLTLIQDRLQGIADRLGTIDQAITNASAPEAQSQPTTTTGNDQPQASSSEAPADTTGSDAGGAPGDSPATGAEGDTSGQQPS